MKIWKQIWNSLELVYWHKIRKQLFKIKKQRIFVIGRCEIHQVRVEEKRDQTNTCMFLGQLRHDESEK